MTPGTALVPAAKPRLGASIKSVFAVGTAAESIEFVAAAFLLIYYNQALGLDPGAAGTALALGMVVNAVFDPMVGSWSDRTRSRWGRRHVFMYASVLPVAVSLWAAFSPPAGLGTAGLTAWLAVSHIVLAQAITVFHTPHIAFGAELTDDYIERSSVMNYNTFCMWLGDAGANLVALRVFFAPAPGVPNGALDPARYPAFARWMAIAVALILFVSAWGTRGRVRFAGKASVGAPRFGARAFVADLRAAMTNRSYVVLLGALLFFSLMTGVRNGLIFYVNSFYWRFDTNQISWFVLGTFGGYALGGVLLAPLHRWLDKRLTGLWSALIYAVVPAVPLLLGLAGVLTPRTPGLLALLIGWSVFQHAPYSVLTTTARSILADLADENELRHGIRQEGILFSARTFFQKIDSALGTALAGWVLALVAFPAKAVVGQVAPRTLGWLAIAYIAASLPGIGAALFYGLIRVSRESHARVRAALDARQIA